MCFPHTEILLITFPIILQQEIIFYKTHMWLLIFWCPFPEGSNNERMFSEILTTVLREGNKEMMSLL